MRYVLSNDILKVEIDSFGAEIKSIKRIADDQEYMWFGDPKFWGRTSPVLFPFVGAVNGKEYRHKGVSYPMGQHGFARDMEFSLVSETETEIFFSLKADEETQKKYPFLFYLQVGYRLEKNSVYVLWKVENQGTEDMYFSIGAHPAFLCPIIEGEKKEDYSIYFHGADQKMEYYFITKDGLEIKETHSLHLESGKLCISENTFDESAYIFENRQVKEVSLVNPEGREYVTVKFDTPLFAVWSPEKKHAPFVCIEPWFGRCDADGFSGELCEREYENSLAPKENFETSYEMIFQ